jgi:hypothetical protein
MSLSKRALLALPLAAALVLAACGDDDDSGGTADTTAAATTAAGGSATTAAGGSATTAAGGGTATSLQGICPDTVIIQTDWNPEAEHGAAYHLVGEGYTIDKDKKTVTGPLVTPDGTDTGVDIEVRIGGPAIGFKQVTAQMYEDPDILLGFVSTDESVQNSADLPTRAVLAPLEKNPQILMWGPEAFPGVTEVKDLPDGTLVVTFGPAVYQDWLVAKGIIGQDQLDGSYNASPARFVAEKGAIAQQGFASAEPYIYENEVPEWGKPVQFQLIHDMGFEIYSQALAAKPENVEKYADCLKAFVPIYQASQVDYLANPAETNALILELVEAYDTGWVYSQGVADFSVAQQQELGLVGNGPDDTLGNMDQARVESIIADLGPIFADQGKPIKEGLTFDDIATNEFVDPSIGLNS